MRTMVAYIIDKTTLQIKTISEEGKVYKLAFIRKKLSAFKITKEESIKILKLLKSLGLIEFCKPGYVRVKDSRLLLFLEKEKHEH